MKDKKDKKPTTADENGVARVEGFVRISDPSTGETIVETRA